MKAVGWALVALVYCQSPDKYGIAYVFAGLSLIVAQLYLILGKGDIK